VVGFDPAGYRLGYGGGFFNRTLAALEPAPITIGLGHATARLETIHPQPHDIPFDFIVTEAGIEARREGALYSVALDEAETRVQALVRQRGFKENNGEPGSTRIKARPRTRDGRRTNAD